jgi:predicted DNA-binding ribbon-helix-helix protein
LRNAARQVCVLMRRRRIIATVCNKYANQCHRTKSLFRNSFAPQGEQIHTALAMGTYGMDMAQQRAISSLHLGVVRVNGRRTSMRLEPEIWSAIGDIACREGFTRSELLDFIESRRPGTPLTSAVRVFVAVYYRELSSGRSHVPAPRPEKYESPSSVMVGAMSTA